jgi:hypothetical protein
VSLGALGAATVTLWAWDPTGGPPLCPLKALTGWDCPFCGGLRGTHDLLHGDVVGALDQNLLLPLYLGLVAGGWALWFAAQRGAGPGSRLTESGRGRRIGWLVVALLVGFAVVRNLPDVAFLPSGPG